MAEFEIKLNKGSIFKNEFKKDNEAAPDYKGKINVDGKLKDIALWVTKSKETEKVYFSVNISEPYQGTKEETIPLTQEDKDDLPF